MTPQYEHCAISFIVSYQVEVFFDFSLTVKAVPHECVIRTGQSQTKVKAENEAWFYSKVTVLSCAIIVLSKIDENRCKQTLASLP